jgi:acyl CoA:acetate/3-ketoacid CoA transferase beta subunit
MSLVEMAPGMTVDELRKITAAEFGEAETVAEMAG